MIPINTTPPVNHINHVSQVKNNETSIPKSVLEGLEYCCYGDTLGTGIEMWPRKRIIENWELLCKEIVFERSPPHDVGLEKGWYSDDTEMSLGVLRALMTEKSISPDLVAQCFLDVYDEFKKENGGVARGGYGSFERIASMENVDRLEELKKFRQEGKFKMLPGNGSGMRVLPVLLYAKEHYPQDIETLLNNIITQAISTHNHACAVLADLVYIDVADAIINGTISFDQTLEYASDFLTGSRTYSHLLPSLDKCHKTLEELSQKFKIPIFGDWDAFVTTFNKQFNVIDKLDGPVDEIGTNLDDVLDQILVERPKAFKKGEVGLSGKANYILYATLYCWKWTLVDFERSKGDFKEAYFSLMKRCISFGGDVDTLLAYVVPVSFLRLKNEKGNFGLPDWLFEGCIEKDKLKERL